MKYNAAFATCGFCSLFLGVILTLNRLFCDSFDGLTYLAIFSISLGLIVLFQCLVNAYVVKNFEQQKIASNFLLLAIVMQVLCTLALSAATGTDWYFFGSQSLFSFGSI